MVDSQHGVPSVSAYAHLPSLERPVLAATFLSVPETVSNHVFNVRLTEHQSNHPSELAHQSAYSNVYPPKPTLIKHPIRSLDPICPRDSRSDPRATPDYVPIVSTLAQVKSKKKYKPVVLKTRPVLGAVPEKFRILRNIVGDPLATLRPLSTNPPPFRPIGRYTIERAANTDKLHSDGMLWPAERDLLHHFMAVNNDAFAWVDSERGNFKSEFFPPIDFPVVPHTPWVQKNIPIPPGLYKEVCALIKKKINAGVYEASNSSYRSRWFCVVKKDGKSLRLVHSLEPLNAVTIQHSGVTPTPEHLAEQFGGRTCGAMLDLFVGYDERYIAESSWDLTTFQTPYGAMRLTTLPMGWTNAVPIFHDDVTYILQPEIPDLTVPYIDDVPVKGPMENYGDECIQKNAGIRRFVWEHFENLNRIVPVCGMPGGRSRA